MKHILDDLLDQLRSAPKIPMDPFRSERSAEYKAQIGLHGVYLITSAADEDIYAGLTWKGVDGLPGRIWEHAHGTDSSDALYNLFPEDYPSRRDYFRDHYVQTIPIPDWRIRKALEGYAIFVLEPKANKPGGVRGKMASPGAKNEINSSTKPGQD
jgi:hypothetical protein